MKRLLITICLFLSGCANNHKIDTTEQYQAAKAHYQSGQLATAKQAFESVLENNPSHIEAQFQLGEIALHEAQLDEAKMHFEAILEQDRRHAKSHYNLGVIYLMQSERYFEYFTATATQKETNPRLFKLLESIQRFSAERTQSDASLDALTDLLSDDKSQ
ncbi:MAG: tetratricopeptide repeat protein [Methylococcales bacterium]